MIGTVHANERQQARHEVVWSTKIGMQAKQSTPFQHLCFDKEHQSESDRNEQSSTTTQAY